MYPNIERFYQENHYALIEDKSERSLRPGKSYTKDVEACIEKFKNFYSNTGKEKIEPNDINVICGDLETNTRTQNIRVMREFGFLKPTNNQLENSEEGISDYYFTETFKAFTSSDIKTGVYILDKLYRIKSIHDMTMYFNSLICTLREAIIYGQVIIFPDSNDKFTRAISSPEKRYEYRKRIYDIYGFASRGKEITDEYTPNISYMFRAELENLGLLKDNNKKIDGLKTLDITTNGLHLLKIIDENLSETQEEKNDINEQQAILYGQETSIFQFSTIPEVFQNRFAQRYITSLLAKPFVILTGNSGTGKTRIATQFAEYMEIKDSDDKTNCLFIPVGADWTDNTKILGFYNPLAPNDHDTTGRYERTAILDLIERANNNPDIPYFIILDEMNLSHVERYFSDFLSHMEIPDYPFELDGYENSPVDYPKNLFITGTVNIDETTYMFSPKVLDRANVIEYKPERNSVLDMFDSPDSSDPVTPAGRTVAEAFLKLSKEIRDGKYRLDDVNNNETTYIKKSFEEIYQITEKKGFEFAYRTVKEIRQYISAAYELNEQGDFRLEEAIDEQLLQKILPKIHGNKKEIGNMLKELEDLCTINGRSLKLSAAKIGQMEEKLNTLQYASFI